MLTVARLKECVSVISENRVLLDVLVRASEIISNHRWYVVGGCIYQTVWNVKTGRPPQSNIGDYDLVYFDPGTGLETQTEFEKRINQDLRCAKMEVTNEALITNEWYEREYGCPKDTPPYLSLEDSIAKMSVSSPVIGVTWINGELELLALADLDRLLALEVFPNSKFRDKRIMPFYKKKYRKWHSIWPQVRFHNWDGQLISSEKDI